MQERAEEDRPQSWSLKRHRDREERGEARAARCRRAGRGAGASAGRPGRRPRSRPSACRARRPRTERPNSSPIDDRAEHGLRAAVEAGGRAAPVRSAATARCGANTSRNPRRGRRACDGADALRAGVRDPQPGVAVAPRSRTSARRRRSPSPSRRPRRGRRRARSRRRRRWSGAAARTATAEGRSSAGTVSRVIADDDGWLSAPRQPLSAPDDGEHRDRRRSRRSADVARTTWVSAHAAAEPSIISLRGRPGRRARRRRAR